MQKIDHRTRAVLLGSGEVLGSIENHNTRQISVRGNKNVLFIERDESLFKEMRMPFLIIFQKLFETVSSEVSQKVSHTLDFFPYKKDFFYQISDKKKNVDIFGAGTIEKAFYFLLMNDIEQNACKVSPTEDEIIELVWDTVKKFENTTFDTKEKVLEALHPWSAQLGVRNRDLMSVVSFASPQIKRLKEKPALVELFRNFLGTVFDTDEEDNNTPFDQIEFAKNDGKMWKLLGINAAENFFRMPIDDENFLDRLKKLTLFEAKHLMSSVESFPILSFESLLEWMDHQLDTAIFKFSEQRASQEEDLHKIIYDEFYAKDATCQVE